MAPNDHVILLLVFGSEIWAELSGDSSTLFHMVMAEMTVEVRGSKMASFTSLEPQLALLAGVWLSLSLLS